MSSPRIDLSSWVMHFVHDRNPENDAAYNLNQGESSPAFPYHEDKEMNSRFELWEMVDEEAGLAPDDDAFCVLLKILEDGHIRSGWSFRGAKPTIYGPRAATCFTEMPLYGLIEYAKQRTQENVGAYAIGLLRTEFFAAGGRPVIYGLSGAHRERPARSGEPFRGWPRYLDPSCGIAADEQYRYVATALGGMKRIDWTHEREWRWADQQDQHDCPGLPVWLKESPPFSKIMIVVPTTSDAEHVLEKLKELHDARSHNFGHEYEIEHLRNTHVVALEELSISLSADEMLTLRLEDIPSARIRLINHPVASPDLIKMVERELKAAYALALTAAQAYAKTAKRNKNGHIMDSCGFSDVMINDAQSDIASALLALGQARVLGGVGYIVSNFGYGVGEQSISMAEAATQAASDYLNQVFPHVTFYTRSRFD